MIDTSPKEMIVFACPAPLTKLLSSAGGYKSLNNSGILYQYLKGR